MDGEGHGRQSQGQEEEWGGAEGRSGVQGPTFHQNQVLPALSPHPRPKAPPSTKPRPFPRDGPETTPL
jgi:hypothetical protein